MAKIKFGAVITDSRGHIGGITYKWSRFGSIAQRTVTPTRRTSNRVTTARSRFEHFTRRWWSDLTPTERTDWRALAAANPRPNVWGTDFPLTGQNLFVGVNTMLLQAGYASLDTAPSDQTVTPMSTLSMTAAAPDALVLTFTPTPLPTDHVLYIFARANFSPGILADHSRELFLLASAEGETSTLDVGPEFAALFGDIVTGRQQFVSVALLNSVNGAISTPITATAIAT